MDVANMRRPKRKQRNKIQAWTKIIFILVFIWFVGNSLFNFCIGLLVDTQIAQWQKIHKQYEVTGYILREEVVINAPATGSIQNRLPPGARAAKNSLLFQVNGSGGTALQTDQEISVIAPISGVISYITDGLENYFKPNELQALDMQKIQQLQREVVDNTKNNMVEKGKRYCKVVNNLSRMQIYLEFPLDLFAEPLKTNQKLELSFPQLEKEVMVPIVDLKGIGNTAQVLVEIPETWYSLINVRSVPLELILDKQEGVFISKEALVTKNETDLGVYCLKKGFVFWQSVKILAEQENNVLVEGIEPFTEIISNPKWVREGQYLY